MSDHRPKDTILGVGAPAPKSAGAATVAPPSRRADEAPPTPIVAPSLTPVATPAPEAPRVPRHVVRIPGRPDLDLRIYEPGTTQLPTRAQIAERDAEEKRLQVEAEARRNTPSLDETSEAPSLKHFLVMAALCSIALASLYFLVIRPLFFSH